MRWIFKKKKQLKQRIRQLVGLVKVGNIMALKELEKMANNIVTKEIMNQEVRRETRRERRRLNKKGRYSKCELPQYGKPVQGGSPGLGKKK